MKKPKRLLLPLLCAAALGVSATAAAVWVNQSSLPVLPREATSVRSVLYAQPFQLAQAYTHSWRAEQPPVSGGMLLVLEVDAPFTIPRNSLENVLYVGDQTAERLNWGTGSGRVVAIVPGLDEGELSTSLLWYGKPELPERVDAGRIAEERAEALERGLTPFTEAELGAALTEGGDAVEFADRTELERYAAELILAYSTEERERAESYLAPLQR